MVLASCFSSCRPPRISAGPLVGNRDATMWHRTVAFSFSFYSCPADAPPPSSVGVGGVLGISVTPTVAQDCVTFVFLFLCGRISPRPPLLRLWCYFGCLLFRLHVPVPILPAYMAVVFLGPISRLPFFLVYLAFRVGYVAAPFRGAVGFEELHLRLMFYFVESTFPPTSPYFCIYGLSDGASIMESP